MKQTKIAVAAKATLAIIEFTAAERAVAEKLPLKQAHRELHQKLTQDLDAALQVVVERYLGHELTDPQIVVGLTTVAVPGIEGETYCMDGMPLLWAGPVTIIRMDDTVRGERKLEELLADS